MRFVIHANNLIRNPRTNKFLVIRENKPNREGYPIVDGQYNIPGGHLEFGEQVLDGAIREAMEEVSLKIDPQYLLGIFETYSTEWDKHGLGFVFYSETEEEPMANVSEVGSCEWLTAEEILAIPDEKILGDKLKPVVQRYLNGEQYSIDVIESLFESVCI